MLAVLPLLAACGGDAGREFPTDGARGHDSSTTREELDAAPLDAATTEGPADVPEAGADFDSTADALIADAPTDADPGESDAGGLDEDGSQEDSGEAGPPCDVDAGCYVIPDGWNLVAYSTIQTACPSGFAAAPPTNFSGYAEQTDACTCGGCALDYNPTCDAFGVLGFHGAEGASPATCGTAFPAGDFYNGNPGTCQTDLPQGDYGGQNLEYLSAPPEGSCSSAGPGTLTSPVTFPWEGEECSPDSPVSAGCSGNVCSVSLPSPFRVCVSASPFRVCPANSVFTQENFAAVGPSASCSTCDCTVTGTCAGTVKLFSDTKCMGSELDVPADGQCYSSPSGTSAIGSYRYAASAPTNVGCAPLAAATVMTSWDRAVTLCCAP